MKIFRVILLLVAGALGLGAIKMWTFSKEFEAGMESWGQPQIFVRSEARQSIQDFGLKIPQEARFPYYYIEGSRDYTCFISCTVVPEAAEAIVQDYAKVGFLAFQPWSAAISAELNDRREPGAHYPQYETRHYDVDSLLDAIFYSDESQVTCGFHFIYDRATQRLYFCEWKT